MEQSYRPCFLVVSGRIVFLEFYFSLFFLEFYFNLFFLEFYFNISFLEFYFFLFFLESYFNLISIFFFSLFAIAILVSMSNGGGRFSGFDSCLNNLATFVILSTTLGRGRGRSV